MKRNFLFIKSTTESTVIPVDSFSHAEYTSDTTVTMYFDAKRGGKDATIAVVLTVSSGKANDVISSITNQITSGKADIMRYDAASTPNKYHTSNVTGITSITTTEAPTITGADGVDGVDADNSKVLLDVRFDEAVSKGDPLYITGYNNGEDRITVAKADASDSAQMPSIGLAAADGAINTNGQAITIGSLDDVDTSSFSVGDVLYVANGGGLTATKPTGTNLIQNVGKVGRSNQNNGEIVVMAIGRSNDLPNLAEGKIWVGDSDGVPEEIDRVLPLKTYGGRFQHTSTTDTQMILAGGIYGTSYYFWNSSSGTTPSGGGTVDTTTGGIGRSQQHYAGVRVPVTGKIRLDAITRPNDTGNSASKDYYLQIWEFTADDSTGFGTVTSTLRASQALTSGTSNGWSQTLSMTTTSEITAGNYIYVTLGMDAQTLSATAYQYFDIALSIIAS